MKKIGGAIYIHRSNQEALTLEQVDIVWEAKMVLAKKDYPCNSYEIIKIDIKNNSVSFIESPDWDISREPIVGDCYRVSEDGSVKVIKRKSNPQIYHHKWMFVAEDYDGFDVEEEKKWSEHWQSVIPKTREIKSRIGYKNYWEKILKEYGLEN